MDLFPVLKPGELDRRYERARRDAASAMESLLFGGGVRSEDVIDAFEMVMLWRCALEGHMPRGQTWELMMEATKP
jgi:hypothetical protein